MQRTLQANDVIYVYMGDVLGGRPQDADCYTDGRLDDKKVQSKISFQQGIDRLEKAYRKQVPLAVMCSESNPCGCHRSRLVGNALTGRNVRVMHIDEKDRLKAHADVINEANRGLPGQSLFEHD